MNVEEREARAAVLFEQLEIGLQDVSTADYKEIMEDVHNSVEIAIEAAKDDLRKMGGEETL